MSISRSILLWASENSWMRSHVPNWKFVRSSVKKFMPGEKYGDAVNAAKIFRQDSIPTVFTRLGENIKDLAEGAAVRDHYLKLIDEISERNLDIEISLKLTQLGFDISFDETYNRFKTIAVKAKEKLGNDVWIDMEGSAYTQSTVEFYKKMKSEIDNAGLCIQAYLFRTEKDLEDLLTLSPKIRLVKGAYKEPGNIAFPKKEDVDKNYLHLAKRLLKAISENNIRAAFATHDAKLCEQIIKEAKHYSVRKNQVEFQMLYGIKPGFQRELSGRGYRLRVLISYGEFWYPWYMRRLAERPANIWFVLKNMF